AAKVRRTASEHRRHARREGQDHQGGLDYGGELSAAGSQTSITKGATTVPRRGAFMRREFSSAFRSAAMVPRLEEFMNDIGRNAALVVLVGCFLMISRANTDYDVVVAQGRKPVVITRIFTGPDGLAHAEDVELKLNSRGATEMLKATGAEFSVRPPTPGA